MVSPGNMSDLRIGLSTDEKPTSAYNGSAFLEMDTGTIYLWNEEGKEWIATFALTPDSEG